MSNNEVFNMYFGIIEDPRCEVNVIHPLVNILKLVMIAVLCGMDELDKIVDYGEQKKDFLEKENNYETFTTLEKSHGRIEKRTCYVINDTEYFTKYLKEWKGLKKIFAVKRIVEKNEEVTTEISCYISSKNATAEELLVHY